MKNDKEIIQDEISFDLTPLQKSIWVAEELFNFNFNVRWVTFIEGELDNEIFIKALNYLIENIELFKIKFINKNEEIKQFYSKNHGLKFQFINQEEFKKWPNAKSWISGLNVDKKFDLSHSLGEAFLAQENKKSHILFFNIQQIVWDGMSTEIFYGLLFETYENLLRGINADINELLRIDQVVEMEKSYLSTISLNKDKVYWDQIKVKNPGANKKGTLTLKDTLRLNFNLIKNKSLKLDKLISEIIIQGSFSEFDKACFYLCLIIVLFHHVLDKSVLKIGFLISDRSGFLMKQSMGPFLKLLPIYVQIDETKPNNIKTLFYDIRTNILGAIRHRKYINNQSPAEKYDFRFNYQKNRASRFGNLRLKSILFPPGKIIEEIETSVSDLDEGNNENISFAIQVGSDKEKDLKNWELYFNQIVDGILKSPYQNISDICLFPNLEMLLLKKWIQDPQALPKKSILDLFKERAEKEPEKIAITNGTRKISYQELNKKSDQLAYLLHGYGVRPETIVGICCERSIEMVIALFAIFKAGGAFLPLDPEYPEERLNFIAEDSNINIILSTEKLIKKIKNFKGLFIDIENWKISEEKEKLAPTMIKPENIAYVMYTSGSTGKPKGVLGTHKGLINRFFWMWNLFPFTKDDICCQKASYSVIGSLWEIFGPLLQGCPLFIIDSLAVKDIATFINILIENKITRVSLIFTIFKNILNICIDQGICLVNVKLITTSGEALEENLLLLAKKVFPNAIILNVYGQTEATSDSIFYNVTKNWKGGSVPIGKPLNNVNVYLLNRYMNPVFPGVVGEIYLSGDGLGRGYLNRPGLTAEKFVPNPFGPLDGERLFRTGDLGRWLPDGNIEFIGRIDQQVKIRGFRVELGEIEAAFNSFEGVKQGAVVVKERAGDKRLVGYYVDEKGKEVKTSELRKYLENKLPEYMVPSSYVRLEKMPLTPSGKVDRRAFPETEEILSEKEYQGPRNATEESLVKIWREVLGLERVGVYDDFFEMGGHSLLATQLIARVRSVLKVDMLLKEIFEHKTLAEFGKRVEEARKTGQRREFGEIKKADRSKRLELSYAQERLWFLDKFEPNSTSYNIPVVLRIRGKLKVNELEWSLNEIVRRHEVLRTRFEEKAGVPEQVIEGSEYRKLEVIDIRESNNEFQLVVEEEIQEPFDLQKGPVFRWKLVKIGEADNVLVIVLHHIAGDGWSGGIFIREINELYRARSRGNESGLMELEIQYADYAHWQRGWLKGEVYAKQLEYWKTKLIGISTLELPTDKERPLKQSFKGAVSYFEFGENILIGLRNICTNENATMYMVLLAAFKILLHQYSGQQDICVGMPIANRKLLEVEGLIGFFVNELVIRTDLSGDITFSELLLRIKESVLGALDHQDFPFEKLVEEIQPARDLARSPLFQVTFQLLNIPMTKFEKLEDLEFSPVLLERRTAIFDFSMRMWEEKGKLKGFLEYSTDLYKGTTIETMIKRYKRIVEGII